MAAPARSHPGAMPPDEAFVRLRRPDARAVALHAGDGSPPFWQVVEHPTRPADVLGHGPTEAEAWKDAAARARSSWVASVAP